MKYKTEQSQPRLQNRHVLYTKPQTSVNIPEVTLLCQQEGAYVHSKGKVGLREPQSCTTVLTTNCLITAEAMLKTPSELPLRSAS